MSFSKPHSAIEFERIVLERRSIRLFDQSVPIPEEVVQACLDLAILAPNSSNLQPWEFYWVRNAEKKKELSGICLSQPAATTAAELIVCVARSKTWNTHRLDHLEKLEALEKTGTRIPPAVYTYYRKHSVDMYRLGWFGWAKKVLFFYQSFGKKNVMRTPTSVQEMEVWAVKSSALACQNLMMAFQAYGYDTCPMEGFDRDRLMKLLELPNDSHITMVISAGKRKANYTLLPRLRTPRSWVVKEI